MVMPPLCVPDIKKLSTCEELVINVLYTLNNLSPHYGRNSAITKKQIQLTEGMWQYLV